MSSLELSDHILDTFYELSTRIQRMIARTILCRGTVCSFTFSHRDYLGRSSDILGSHRGATSEFEGSKEISPFALGCKMESASK